MCADKYVCVQESVRSEYKHMFLREARMRQHEAVEEERQRRKEEAVVLDVLNRRARRLCVCVYVCVCVCVRACVRARALSLSLSSTQTSAPAHAAGNGCWGIQLYAG